jgi:folate-binding protein YgfZ
MASACDRRHIRPMAQAKTTRLPDRALVAVTGPDWRSFLQGLVTQDMERQAVGELRYGALLTPQGRLLFDLFILPGTDSALLDVEAARRDAFIQRLSMYRLRARVTIERAEGGVFVLWGTTSAPTPWLADPRLPALGFRAYGLEAPASPGADATDAAAFDTHRLSLGAPDPARDCAGETTYPIEANLDLLGGIDFSKGCFVGQETTSRMKRRGPVKSRMLPVVYDGAPPPFGSEVMAGSLRAGEILSSGPGRALALFRLDRALGADLTVEGMPVRLEIPDWIPVSES